MTMRKGGDDCYHNHQRNSKCSSISIDGSTSSIILATAGLKVKLDNDENQERKEKQKEMFPFWLFFENDPGASARHDGTDDDDTATTTSSSPTKKENWQRQGALVVNNGDAATAAAAAATACIPLFQNGYGYTSQKITSLEELRDTLNTLIPPPKRLSAPITSEVTKIIPATENHHRSNVNPKTMAMTPTTTTSSPPPSPPHPTHDHHDHHDHHDYYDGHPIAIRFNNNKRNINKFPNELDEVKRYELFREVIEHEDDILNQRVSWIILAQSFLMAAFISTSGDNNLKYITATVGLLTVIVTMPAIVAAAKNIEIQQKVYFLQIESDERCIELHGHTRDGNKDNIGQEQLIRNTRGHILPNTAFRGGSIFIKILDTVVGLSIVQIIGWVCLLIVLIME